jgi:O-antigen/teichoic acid export membrane protein
VFLWNSLSWRPTWQFSLSSLRDIGSFGGSVFGVRVSDYVRTNGERLLIGRVLGSAALGNYSVAFNVLLSPVGRFLIAVMDTLFPVLSRLQDEPARMGAVWLRVNRLFAAVFIPAVLGLAMVAQDFVVVMLGQRWADVAPLLQILAVGIVIQVVTALGAEVMKAAGHASQLLRFSGAEAALLLAGSAAGLWWGIQGVAAAYVLVSLVTRTFFMRLVTGAIGMPLRRFGSSLSGVVQASLVLLTATYLVQQTLASMTLPAWMRLLLTVLTGAAVYIPVCIWRVPEIREEFTRMRHDALGWRNAISTS